MKTALQLIAFVCAGLSAVFLIGGFSWPLFGCLAWSCVSFIRLGQEATVA